jgi:hypothetical protein
LFLSFGTPPQESPAHSGKSLKAVKVKFSTGTNGYIDSIHIWDGDAPKVKLDHLQLKGAETKIVPLSPEQTFTSVGVSIKVKAGPGEDARVQISSVCGTFLDSASVSPPE